MPFIRKVCVLSKTRLIFPHINGPNVTPLNDKRLRKKFKVDSGKAVAGSSFVTWIEKRAFWQLRSDEFHGYASR